MIAQGSVECKGHRCFSLAGLLYVCPSVHSVVKLLFFGDRTVEKKELRE